MDQDGERAERTLKAAWAIVQRLDAQRVSFWMPPKVTPKIGAPPSWGWKYPRELRTILDRLILRNAYRGRFVILAGALGVFIFGELLQWIALAPLLPPNIFLSIYTNPYSLFSRLFVPIAFIGLFVYVRSRGRHLNDREITESFIDFAHGLIRKHEVPPPDPLLLYHNDYQGLTYRSVGERYEAKMGGDGTKGLDPK